MAKQLLEGFIPKAGQIPVFQKFYNLHAKITFLECHRRFGKDTVCFLAMVLLALQNPGNYYYGGPNLRQMRRLIWDMKLNQKPILSYIPQECVQSIDNTEMRITLINGSVIQLIGFDNGADSFVGVGAKMIVISEATLTSALLWGYILPIAIMDKECQFVLNYTPRPGTWPLEVTENPPSVQKTMADLYQVGKDEMRVSGLTEAEYGKIKTTVRNGITKKEFDEATEYYKTHEFIEHIALDVGQTGMLNKLELELERQACISAYGNDNLYRQEFLLDHNAANATSVYGEFMEQARKEGRMQPLTFNNNYEVYCALDLGMDDKTVMVFFQLIGQRLLIMDCFVSNNKVDDYYINIIKNYPVSVDAIFLPHDSNQRNKRDGISTFQYYTTSMPGKRVVFIPKTTSVETDIILIRQYFASIYFNQLSRGVKNLCSILDKYDYKRDKNGLSTGTLEHNDEADAFRYAVIGAYRLFGLFADARASRGNYELYHT